MTVYVAHHDNSRDISDAQRFGDIHVIFRSHLFPDTIDAQLHSIAKRARRTLANFNSDEDFVCLIGSPVYIALCLYTLGEMRKRVRLLAFDRLERSYYEIPLPYIYIKESPECHPPLPMATA